MSWLGVGAQDAAAWIVLGAAGAYLLRRWLRAARKAARPGASCSGCGTGDCADDGAGPQGNDGPVVIGIDGVRLGD